MAHIINFYREEPKYVESKYICLNDKFCLIGFKKQYANPLALKVAVDHSFVRNTKQFSANEGASLLESWVFHMMKF